MAKYSHQDACVARMSNLHARLVSLISYKVILDI